MAEPDLSNVTAWGSFAGFAVAFVGAAVAAVYRFIKSLPEHEQHARPGAIVLETASIADTRPLFILLERNVAAVERAAITNDLAQKAITELLLIISKRLDDDETERRAQEIAADRRFRDMVSNNEKDVRGRRDP